MLLERVVVIRMPSKRHVSKYYNVKRAVTCEHRLRPGANTEGFTVFVSSPLLLAGSAAAIVSK